MFEHTRGTPCIHFLNFRGVQKWILSLKIKRNRDFRLLLYSSIKVYKYTVVFNLAFLYQNSCLSIQGGPLAFISEIFEGFKSEFFPLKSKEFEIFGFFYTRLSKSIKIPLFLIKYFSMKIHVWAYTGDPLHSFPKFSRGSKVNSFP